MKANLWEARSWDMEDTKYEIRDNPLVRIIKLLEIKKLKRIES